LFYTCFSSTELTKIVVIGGYTNERQISNVEIVDLSGKGLTCPQIPDYPLEIDLFTAVFYDGKIIACGGYDGDVLDDCFTLGPDLTRWNQIVPLIDGKRSRMASSIIDTKWFISGGFRNSGSLKSTLVFDGSQFSEGPELPALKRDHCQVSINVTHMFFTNGGAGAFTFDWENQEYGFVDDIPSSIYDGSCGVINNANHGLEVLVVDESFSYIFSLTHLEWRDGPKLPVSTVDSFPVQLNYGFLSIGGQVGSSYHSGIYRFDENAYDWVLEAEQLETPRRYAAAVAVPDSFLNCV